MEFFQFLEKTVVSERNVLEKWSFRNWLLAGFPGANIKEFLVTILSETKRLILVETESP